LSIQFNDTTNYKGLVQLYEREMGYDAGYISGNTQRLKQFTADVNLAWDEFLTLAGEASGTWQFDDSNHGDYPIIYFNIVSGQSDYSFSADENGNLVLDIHKVGILDSATSTQYVEIGLTDQQSSGQGGSIFSEDGSVGTPIEYDKTANGIFLSPTPNYNATKGVKVAINREASYFVYTDTTKKPGVPGTLQSWFFKYPSFEQAKRKSTSNKKDIEKDILKLKEMIKEVFSRREKDNRHIMTGKKILYI
jgi:hypothetical protein